MLQQSNQFARVPGDTDDLKGRNRCEIMLDTRQQGWVIIGQQNTDLHDARALLLEGGETID
jgi:hypothetical protein